MSNLANVDIQPGADTSTGDTGATLNEDDALGAVWDQMHRENGSDRGDDGRFKSAGGEGLVEGEEGEGLPAEGAEGEEGGQQPSPAASQTVALPPNWNGMDEDWKKIPADVQAKIATRDAELHSRMSEQGRQISGFRPFMDIVGKNRDLFDGKTMPDGTAITPEYAVDYLMGIQRRMDSDPIRTMIDIADSFGLRESLAAVLTGRAPIPAATAKAPAAPQAADVEAMVQRAFQSQAQASAMEQELSRLTNDKPLYAEIPEDDMVHSINRARAKLGQAASHEAVFTLAYDMAVNADPDLRKKAAAAAKPVAAAQQPKRAEAGRQAASVNVTSRQTGKGRAPTEDEILGAAYDAAHAKD